MSLNEKLKDWTDLDIALHYLALELCNLKDDNFPENKWLYWTQNEFSKFLDFNLKKLIEFGVIEIDENEEKVRLVNDFKIKK